MLSTLDPLRSVRESNAFAAWVEEVAQINEQFSETIRDTADLLATIEPSVALALYQAADQTNITVLRLHKAALLQPKPWTIISAPWVFLCGLVIGGLAALL